MISSGQYPYYGATGIQDYVADYIFDGRYLLLGEDGEILHFQIGQNFRLIPRGYAGDPK